ncbi:MAG TPA: DUF1800 domain-containing protein, partial [Planctomycetota bacterium]|nr:DUF1800 domain-containing protein [Planctomycetota bacterium]
MSSTAPSRRASVALLLLLTCACLALTAVANLPAAELAVTANPDWNYEKAAHLLARAGFGGTPKQIE